MLVIDDGYEVAQACKWALAARDDAGDVVLCGKPAYPGDSWCPEHYGGWGRR